MPMRYNEFLQEVGPRIETAKGLKEGDYIAIPDKELKFHFRVHRVTHVGAPLLKKFIDVDIASLSMAYVGLRFRPDNDEMVQFYLYGCASEQQPAIWPEWTISGEGFTLDKREAYHVQHEGTRILGDLIALIEPPRFAVMYRSQYISQGGNAGELVDYADSIRDSMQQMRELAETVKKANR